MARKTAWQHLEANPPAFVYLMARRRLRGKCVQALSLEEVAVASGLPLPRVTEISWLTDWHNVSVAEAERFIAGCNYDPLNFADRNRKNAYVRSSKKRNPRSMFTYLKSSPLWESQFKPRINLLKSLKSSSTQ